ncbi:MAG: U32 family peptidase [Ruminococcus sp.]|nr:U32 family peptidase [Ruminococcus sp.]
MMKKIEILAPCGSRESVIAAVRSGADAVYLGMKSFSARASAKNFDENELTEAVAYCHQRDVKVYLAINTLMFDSEMIDAVEAVKTAAKADIDAVIVQDMGLCEWIRKTVPELRLHASTQMSVHTPYGAKALYELGFKRVVLSRELSLDEIKAIHDFCPEIELEVFVHGALCMCLSGQCLFSSVLGGRSANRGMCAQPCRLPFFSGENDHALSLKDNSAVSYIRQLQEIGVTSAKIEGRMKREEYVATAVSACAQSRDNGFVDETTATNLRSVFSRAGFTDGYIRGELGEEMFGFRQKDDVALATDKLLKEIRNTYRNEAKRLDVDFSFHATVGERATLTAFCLDREISVFSDLPVEEARTLPLSEEKIRENLSKTGNTQYQTGNISIQIPDNISMPLSALNAMRRSALKEMDQALQKRHDYQINEHPSMDVVDKCSTFNTLRYATAKSAQILPALKDFDLVFLDLFAFDGVDHLPDNIAVEVPRALFSNEQEAYKRLKELKASGVDHAMVHNIASLRIAKELGFTVHAGFGLNITNSYALDFYARQGVVDAELSAEIDFKKIEKLKKSIPVGVIAYGYLPLMITRNAPIHQKSCKNIEYLQDRRGERFPVIKGMDCYEILNCVPLILPQKNSIKESDVFRVFRFSVDNSVDKVEKILENLRENDGFERFTHGLYLKGVKNFTIV